MRRSGVPPEDAPPLFGGIISRDCVYEGGWDANPAGWVPPGLVEITCRVMQRRLLLRPSQELREIIDDILARAARRTGMRVCAYIYLSNHCHLLLRPSDAQQLS